MSDPYLKIGLMRPASEEEEEKAWQYSLMFDDKTAIKTPVIKATLNPVFQNVAFSMAMDPPRPLGIQCFDWDKLSSDDFIV